MATAVSPDHLAGDGHALGVFPPVDALDEQVDRAFADGLARYLHGGKRGVEKLGDRHRFLPLWLNGQHHDGFALAGRDEKALSVFHRDRTRIAGNGLACSI